MTDPELKRLYIKMVEAKELSPRKAREILQSILQSLRKEQKEEAET